MEERKKRKERERELGEKESESGELYNVVCWMTQRIVSTMTVEV